MSHRHAPRSTFALVPAQLGAPGGTVGGIDARIVLAAGVIIASLLVATGVLTLAVSVYQAVRRRRREAVTGDVLDALLDRLYGPDDPDWEDWVDTLSRPERDAAEALLDEYLRTLEGSYADRLRGLGEALDIPARSRDRLGSRGLYARLRALTWLTLLRDPPAAVQDGSYAPSAPRERAAVARLVHETDPEGAGERAAELLLADAHDPFPAFGVDTLYRVTRTAPEAVVARAADERTEWSADLTAQVLLVCRSVGSGLAGADLSWVVALLVHPDERVRVEAALTLAAFGWRTPVREEAFLRRTVDDESPKARAAGYQMLAAWDDDRSSAVLREALADEDDERARLAGARALYETGVEESAVPAAVRPAYRWVREHDRYDDRARRTDAADTAATTEAESDPADPADPGDPTDDGGFVWGDDSLGGGLHRG